MGINDQLTSPQALNAMLSWRGPLSLAVAVVAVVAGLPWPAAVGIGVALYGALVLKSAFGSGASAGSSAARPDPFTVGEPWRRFVQDAERAQRQLVAAVAGLKPGPIQARLVDISSRINRAVAESYAIAQRGHAIDKAVNEIDPVRLRSRLRTLVAQRDALPAEALGAGNLPAAIASVESQLESADRLKAKSAATADRLRLTQARLDELVARATEVGLGVGDTDGYAHEVDDLVTELEGLRLAVEETNSAEAAFRIEDFGTTGEAD